MTQVPVVPDAPLRPGSVSLRLYPPALGDPAAVLHELEAQAALAVASGFEGVMLSERHGGAWGQIPNPLQAASWLLAAMPSGWVAPCPILLPLRRAALVAEELAWLDARFPGRVAVGFGAGGNAPDFAFVGVPFEERAERFDRVLRETVALLRPPADAPEVRDPALARVRAHPIPLLSASTGPRSVARAGELGLGLIGSSLLAPERTRELLERYVQHGGAGPHVVIVRAWLGTPPWELIDHQMAEYRAAGDARGGTAFTGEVIHGDDPVVLAERIAAALRATRADAANLRVHVAGLDPAAARDQVEIMGREVLPRLRAQWPT